MIKVGLVTDKDRLAELQNAAKTFPAAIGQWARREVRPFVSHQVDLRLRRAPGSVHYPIQWTSEKQRLAFFASDGFGHGIPYQRKDQLQKEWQVRADYADGLTSISLSNPAPQAAYVYGDEKGQHQQVYHYNTGWPRFVDQAQVIALETDAFIADGIQSVIAAALRTNR
ncbi:MAG: hypothetical protein EHM39_14475 [Chloroflexi bacterium]|nr:MAG: hypothetical protein EHM39_14475 [Chloroflexota bacterium]